MEFDKTFKMTSLCENQIKETTRLEQLSSVTRLKLWAKNISDIELLSKKVCPALKIANFSVNKLDDISPLKECTQLEQLYLRQNNLENLEKVLEILKVLPALRILWIQANPCTRDNNYQNKVLDALPNLQKLDGKHRSYFLKNLSQDKNQVAENMTTLSSTKSSEADVVPELAESEKKPSKRTQDFSLLNHDKSLTPKKTVSDALAKTSSNILRASLALVQELTKEDLLVLKETIDSQLSELNRSSSESLRLPDS